MWILCAANWTTLATSDITEGVAAQYVVAAQSLASQTGCADPLPEMIADVVAICGENTRIDPEEDPAGLNDGLQGSIAGYAEFITDALRAFKGLKVSKGVLTFGTANASHSGQFCALRGRLGALREILTANMGTSDGAYKGWETRRGAIARDIKSVRRAMRTGLNQGRSKPEALTRGKYRIDLDYGRPGNAGVKSDDGYGTSHAESKHAEDLHRMPVTLARGSIHQHDSDPNKLFVVHGNHVAVLRAQERNDGSRSQTRYGLTTHYHDTETASRVRALPAVIEGR